jgi:Ni,Fe-hydrogenase I large subunit
MSNKIDELINSPTLAPLQENFYTPKSMSTKDANILASISKSTIQSIESSIGSLVHLTNNLKIFKETLVDSINLQAEQADLTNKYAKDIPQQSHILPGIVQTPVDYDMSSIRGDNERMIQMKDELDKVMKQKEVYLRLSEEDVRLFLASWKRIVQMNVSFDEFIYAMGKRDQ